MASSSCAQIGEYGHGAAWTLIVVAQRADVYARSLSLYKVFFSSLCYCYKEVGIESSHVLPSPQAF